MNRPDPSARLWLFASMVAVVALGWIPQARVWAQNGTDQLSKILTDPEKLEELKKEKLRPPIEFFRSQVMPNDILPYLKANHWSMVGLEMRANHEDYEGSLQTRAVMLADQPHEIVYRRDARLVKGQRTRLTLPILLPIIPKELGFQLVRPEAIRQDEEWLASLRILEPHQQMVVVLSKTANDAYTRWSQFRATTPFTSRRDDPIAMDKQRYYRMVLPMDPEKPLLSAHPLTWSAISHVIWDGQVPEAIGVGQQQAMVDWLHWGGQLIVTGGAGPMFAPLRESFLSDYLPADPSGENVMRSGDQLLSMAKSYAPVASSLDREDPVASNIPWREAYESFGRRYKPFAKIPATDKKPMFIAGLTPRPGATVIPLGGPDDPPLGVEWRVGRGRVLMLSVSLTDPDLLGWPGFDTFVRRVVLRRPEERITAPMAYDTTGTIIPPQYESLNGLDLTGLRYVSRDIGAPVRQPVDEDGQPINKASYTGQVTANDPGVEVPVGEWLDSSELPKLSRDVLEKASGIEIPGRSFVRNVILAYILVLVPLNYLLCRFVFRRREWAWVLVPTLSFAFAIGVERAAAYDVGYDSSCDEVDLIETHGGYSRGHISRFASLYSTGRVRFSISYPNDPTALALPLATGRSLRGEDSTQSNFQIQPIPALTGFQVQPRSLSMFRAEQLASLPGTLTLSPENAGPRTITNDSGLDLNEAWVVEIQQDKQLKGVFLGAIAAGAKVPLGSIERIEPKLSAGSTQLDPGLFVKLLLDRAVALRPEDVGELRLIGWSNKPLGGQTIDPPVDRQRGFTLVVSHLQPSPLPNPASARYDALAIRMETPPKEPPVPVPDPNTTVPGLRIGPRPNSYPQPKIVPGGSPGAPTVPPAVETPVTPDPSTNPNALETPRP